MEKWISVEEKLPEYICHAMGHPLTTVLVAFGGHVCEALYIDGYFKTMGVRNDTVTHWMPLPNPPNEVSNMKRYAVAHTDSFENDLKIEIIEAEDWKSALSKHSKLLDENGNPDDNSWLPDNIEDAKQSAFDADFQFDVIELE